MSEGAPLAPETLLESWPDRWRYPDLVVVLADRDRRRGAAGSEASQTDVCEALLAGLATPVDDAVAALTELVGRGEFPAATDVANCTALNGALVGTEKPVEYVRAAQRAAEAELSARRASLRQRARRAGMSEEPPEVATVWAEGSPWRREAAETELRAWTERLMGHEAKIEGGIRRQLAALDQAQHAELIKQINGCLTAREYRTAAQLLGAGPDAYDETGGPGTVAQGDYWLWPAEDVEQILRWYRDQDAPPAFSRWRPGPDDTAAKALLAAVVDLLARPGDEVPVGAFARALDRCCGTDAELAHRVSQHAAGHRSVLHGIVDARFPWLALPRPLPLYVGPPGGEPPDDGHRPGVWFVPELLRREDSRRQAAVARGLAVLDLETVFRLAAPTRDPHGSPVFRRVNLIREICGQLTVADLLGPRSLLGDGGDEPGGSRRPSPELRDALAWLLNLLGVDAEVGVLDVLLHDTGQRTGALRAAVTDLLAGAGPARNLTLADVAAWRGNQKCMANLRETILPAIGDLEVAVVVDAAVWRFGEQARPFTAAEVRESLAAAGARPAAAASPAGPREHSVAVPPADEVPPEDGEAAVATSALEHLNIEAALTRACSVGLFEPRAGSGETVYVWTDQALPLLLSILDLERRVTEGLSRLDTQRELSIVSAQEARLEARKKGGLAGALHRVKGRVSVIRECLEELHPSPEDAKSVRFALDIIVTLHQFWELADDVVLTSAFLAKHEYDLTVLLQELKIARDIDRGPDLELAGDSTRELPVHGGERMMRHALNNLIDNAATAVDRKSGRMRLTVQRDGLPDGGATVTLDLEDDGPGLDEDMIQRLNDPALQPSGESGHGVRHARTWIEDNGGALTFLENSAELGGAHVRVTLPQARRPEPRPGP